MSGIFPLRYQSGMLDFSDWASLITLCLAPLIAHVAAGAPEPSCLSSKREPRWHDRICHYNPTSIIWRYFAITDRRIRARSWTAVDMAAANALFWTDEGWDGSEAMAQRSIPLCSRLPHHARASILSWDMVKTIIVGLQAVQAVYGFSASLDGSSNFIYIVALNNIFLPIGFLGFYRFCAAFWLTDQFDFVDQSAPRPTAVLDAYHLPALTRTGARGEFHKGALPGPGQEEVSSRLSLDSLLNCPHEPAQRSSSTCNQSQFRPTSHWASILFRIFYMLPLLALDALFVLYVAPWPYWYRENWAAWGMPTAAFAELVMYTFVFVCSTVICAYYLARGANTTTVIPCAGRLWYKIYSVAVGCLMAVALVLMALETAKTPCGVYTSWPVPDVDTYELVCSQRMVLVGGAEHTAFGVATRPLDSSETSSWEANEFRVRNFTGVIMVSTAESVVQRATSFASISSKVEQLY